MDGVQYIDMSPTGTPLDGSINKPRIGLPGYMNVWDHGYLLGAANSPLTDTFVYIDEFKLSTQPLI